MAPREYYDWWFFSGVCLGDPARPANYAALRERLSAAGLHLIVLWDLLLGVKEGSETAYAGYQHIHGAAARMAAAAGAVGAKRLATWLSTLPDPTVIPETHAELTALLKDFARRHKAELAADMARHGDPRKAPGFDRRRARPEREAEWGANNARYQIEDRVPFLAASLRELRSYLARGLTLAEIIRQNDEMAGFAGCLRYDVPRWASSPQPPAVTAFLAECRRLSEQYPAQLQAWGSG